MARTPEKEQRRYQNRVRVRPGDVFAIRLGDEYFAYCRDVADGNFEFFSERTIGIGDIDDIRDLSVAFTIPVSIQLMKAGEWPKVGRLPLEERRSLPVKYSHRAVGSEQIEIYENGEFRPASMEEAEGLERLALWREVHVVDRLRDMFYGKRTVWVEQTSENSPTRR